MRMVTALSMPLLLAVSACQDVPSGPPQSQDAVLALSPAVETDVVSVTSGLILNEAGYKMRVMVEGLDLPQGTVQLGNGPMFVNATGPNQIVQVLPSGAKTTFASFPAPGGLVDLIFDPGRGLFASTIGFQLGLATPIWQVRVNGDTTRFAAVAGFQTFLALDGAGRLYVTQAIGGVVRVALDGSITQVVVAPNDTRLRGITFDGLGQLYVLAAEEAQSVIRIRRFDLSAAAALPISLGDGELVTDDLPVAPGTHAVEDLTFWPRGGGDLFTVDAGNVYRVKLDGTISVFATGLADTTTNVFNTLALSGAGDLLITEYAAGRVTRISR